jgi:hypothetical protein
MEPTAERSMPVMVARSVEIVLGSSDLSPEAGSAASASQPAAALAVSRSASPSSSAALLDDFDGRASGAGMPMLLALRSAVLRTAGMHATALPSTPVRSTAMAPPALMRAPQSRSERSPDTGAVGGPELVLVARTADADGRVMAIQKITSGVVPSAAPVPAAGGGRALAVGAGLDGRGAQASGAGAKTQIDLDELVEKTWQKLMRKVAIEQERRGYTRWPWQS